MVIIWLLFALGRLWPVSGVVAQTTSPAALTLGPGQSARVGVYFWGLSHGRPFPTAVTGPIGRTWETVGAVLEAAAARDVLGSDPYQVQMAIWRVYDGSFHDAPGTEIGLAQELVTAASTQPLPAQGSAPVAGAPGAETLAVAVERLDVFPLTDDQAAAQRPFHATGTLVISNTGDQELSFTLTGAVFGPLAPADAQLVVAQADPRRPAVILGPIPGPATPTRTPPAATGTNMPGSPLSPTPMPPATFTATPPAVTQPPTATATPTPEIEAFDSPLTEPTGTEPPPDPDALISPLATPANLPLTGRPGANRAAVLLMVGLGLLILVRGLLGRRSLM